MATTTFTIRLERELKRKLEEEARREDRSASALANRAIRRMLEERAAKRRLIESALAEADKGEFISEEAMLAWFDALGTEDERPGPVPDVIIKDRT